MYLLTLFLKVGDIVAPGLFFTSQAVFKLQRIFVFHISVYEPHSFSLVHISSTLNPNSADFCISSCLRRFPTWTSCYPHKLNMRKLLNLLSPWKLLIMTPLIPYLSRLRTFTSTLPFLSLLSLYAQSSSYWFSKLISNWFMSFSWLPPWFRLSSQV